MIDHVLASAKAYAALVGAILTAVITSSATPLPSWVGIIAAVCTAVATYAVPNTAAAPRRVRRDERGSVDILTALILLGVVLLLFGIRFH